MLKIFVLKVNNNIIIEDFIPKISCTDVKEINAPLFTCVMYYGNTFTLRMLK